MRLILIALLASPLLAQNGLTATNLTNNQIQLDWTASSGLTAPQYLIERCSGKGCSNFAQVAAVAAPTYVDAGLGHYTFYAYRVRATDGANFSSYGRVAGATTVDLVLQSSSGDRCTAVTSMGSNPLVTFTCNQSSPGGLPGLRTTTTLNNVNNVPNGVGYGLLSLGGTITCIVAVNEDPTNAGNAVFGQTIVPGDPPTSTMILTPLPPSTIAYSCATDGTAAGSGVWTIPPPEAKKSLIVRILRKIGLRK